MAALADTTSKENPFFLKGAARNKPALNSQPFQNDRPERSSLPVFSSRVPITKRLSNVALLNLAPKVGSKLAPIERVIASPEKAIHPAAVRESRTTIAEQPLSATLLR
ncbi:hypothetical protein AD948_15755 [Acetobacter senegalensis]|uniref:Uncharacterized protein n=1 Tax=Acetobacter senegalensis TaxID=446692 RepID=A0A149TV40_9PROT|nr:hypothetical protein [Acetobacter senegalensis]KXV57085.1 hypothetical protein AD948_15755 [Acetobacter senegalensis]